MKINKYTKLKNGMYKLYLENDEIILHEELILKHSLLLTKEIDDNEIYNLQKENFKYYAYNDSLKYLKTKLRCEQEIIEYLKKKSYEMETIKEVIDILHKQGYLNDEIYVNCYINDKINLTLDGPYKIRRELENKKINIDLINNKLFEFTEELEKERIKRIIDKQIKLNKKSEFQFKLKIKEYLSNLGYSNNLIYNEINNINIDDSLLKEKEYDKLYKKYKNKYKDNELEYKIKNELYKKGYRD